MRHQFDSRGRAKSGKTARQNDTTAIYSGHADRDRSVETAAIQRANEGVIKGSCATRRNPSCRQLMSQMRCPLCETV